MKKKLVQRKVTTTFILSILLLSYFIIPSVNGKQRKVYLTDFVLENRQGNTGFSNSVKSPASTLEATVGALEILNFYNLFAVPSWFGENGKWFGEFYWNVNVSEVGSYLEDLINVNINSKQLLQLFYVLKSISILNQSLDDTTRSALIQYIFNLEHSEGGIGRLSNVTIPDIASTYLGIEILSYLGVNPRFSTKHVNWTKNCLNTDGGFGATSSSPSTLVSTYYGLSILDKIGDLNDDLLNPEKTISYLKTFYISPRSDVNNFGGCLPEYNAKYALLSSTYYYIESMSLIDATQISASNRSNTIAWVLDRQNVQDGGFVDNTDGNEPIYSSISVSYYAFKILERFDSSIISLEEDIWMADFNWWGLIILLGIIIGLGFGLYYLRERRKI